MNETISNVLLVLFALMGTSILIALIGLLALVRGIRRLQIPPDADYFTTMRYIPLVLVVLLDLLDFGLDIFSAPLVWVILNRMGLYSLRNKAAIEALIPFTQPIPTFTLSWIAARVLKLGDLSRVIESGRWEDAIVPRQLQQTKSRSIHMDDR